MILYCIVDVAQNTPNTILILYIQLEKRNHAKIINQARHGFIQSIETRAGHYRIFVRRIEGSCTSYDGIHGMITIIFQQRSIGIQESLELSLRDGTFDQIHFGEDVDVGDFEHDHGAHGGEGAGEEFGAVDDEGGFEEVGGAEGDVEGAEAGEVFDEGGDDGDVGVELDLAGEVEDDEVFFGEGL